MYTPNYSIKIIYSSFSKILFEASNLTNILTKENITITSNGKILSPIEYSLKENHPTYNITPNNSFEANSTISFFITINDTSSNVITIYYSLITSNYEKSTYSLLKFQIPKDKNISLYNLSISSLNNQPINSSKIEIPIYSSIDTQNSIISPLDETEFSYTLQVQLKNSSNTSLPNGEYTLTVLVD